MMAFEIVLSGVPQDSLRHRIADLVGADRMCEIDGHLVVSLPDQVAVVGVLQSISALGCDVDAVRRCELPEP